MRNVLILVDDYTSAAAAARHIAAKIAPGQVDRALLLHVHAPIRSYAAQFFGAEALRSMREADGARLAGDARASLEGAGVKVEVRTEQGEIAPVTVEVARERAVPRCRCWWWAPAATPALPIAPAITGVPPITTERRHLRNTRESHPARAAPAGKRKT